MSWRALLSRNVQEIRFVFCPQAPSSAGAREFVKKNYADLKTLNPRTPIVVRPWHDEQARVIALYDFGEKELGKLDNLNESEVEGVVRDLVLRGSGLPTSPNGLGLRPSGEIVDPLGRQVGEHYASS